MAKNIIMYGPPGTGKTYLLQSLMNDYIDYDIDDTTIKSAYVAESKEWILITLILLQNHGKMSANDIQKKVDSLSLGVRINVAAELDLHNIQTAPIAAVKRELPRVFMEVETNKWYVDLVRVQQAKADFYSRFLSS